jgi:hypothetical protein
VRLATHDVQGREVACLVDGERAAGHHVADWGGLAARGAAAVAPGVHLVRLESRGAPVAKVLALR